MNFFGGQFFGGGFFGVSVTDVGGGKARPWEQKWRQELVERLLEQQEQPEIKVPAQVKKAIRRVIEKAPPDDSAAIKTLRGELSRLQVGYRATYVEALRYEIAKATQEAMLREQVSKAFREQRDEEELLLILLH